MKERNNNMYVSCAVNPSVVNGKGIDIKRVAKQENVVRDTLAVNVSGASNICQKRRDMKVSVRWSITSATNAPRPSPTSGTC